MTELMLIAASSASNAADNPFMEMAQPVVSLLNMVITPALLIVGALGAISCILLGVKYAKARNRRIAKRRSTPSRTR